MLIETFNLTKKYGKKLALNKVNLKINRGQLVAYLGTNGAGKSTTINILIGLLKPTSGTITYAKDLKIGVVFQNSVLDDVLTVKENLYLRARMYKTFSKEWLEKLIGLIGIRSFLNQKYGTLSGGQKRRVDIARALIDHPDILFLDEPTTGLDLQTRIVIWDLLQKLQKEQGLTIFLTTHYLEEAENADQMYILENGNVLAEGSAEEIKEMYAPSRLLICLKQGQTFSTNFKQISKSDDQIEIDGLNSNQVIDLLHKFEDKIDTFEYRKGSIDDAFIKIAGKELQ
ncbi:ABC transporter ATP-binding protein [Lactobacillus crispatus]|jgi:multidrug/hemolysin transport system ATP-binding protein|uniref:ABC transporter ATP-binding protein n=2 Tax=Lactobacillus TaxID=1578 RepID=A0AAW6XFP5_9LACO|nr:ABC transporter ATP-binding protein [Lactobacillus crispatus]MBU3828743.1 ABC transporter ATP-binding protein [Candidatus Lactobacillus pullistercoris]EEU19386.1 ABC transporter, ATP-binding protein [Lactobacillus crispatus 125-2-CHN]EFE00175.1 ABC transporter, ATP-binding protein [Lactobacillus crispatus 214-1]MBA2915106.1 ABC transporter ATP-binding protein [Lactobacillus crispatus]MBO4165761.1 ABC transporter ATP-binding protein [Lactobacillus crispatus]